MLVSLPDGRSFTLADGHVVIAAITSCTNTSNPQVMMAAGLLAQKAVDRGLRPPWVKTSLAPGSLVVTDYYERAGLIEPLAKLGFNVVGYGCTTCIGNSGPLAPEISSAITEEDLSAVSVLSGNRNFEGRIHPDSRMNYLASPPLVVAYALAGTMDIDLNNDPLGTGSDGVPVYLRDIWPDEQEVTDIVAKAIDTSMYLERYATILEGDEHWRALPALTGDRYDAGSAVHLHSPAPPSSKACAPRRRGGGCRSCARARLARRQRDDRPHLACGCDSCVQPGGGVARGARRGAARLQLLRVAPWKSRSDDARHVREHTHSQSARPGHRRRRDPSPS